MRQKTSNLFLRSIVLTFLIISPGSIVAQSLPVGTPVLEDYYRRMQLISQIDTTLSFSVRPLSLSNILPNVLFDRDSINKSATWAEISPSYFAKGRVAIKLLPLNLQQQYNSDHPYGWNDGPMIPAKGYQTVLSGGIYLKYGPVSIQLRPEFVHAANQQFTGFADVSRSNENLTAYYSYYNLIDAPERFGQTSYNKLFWGQSALRVTFDPISIGLSSENVWWGPGIRNSLLLSNNAPGFKHLTLNTVRPVKTYFGYFEGQLIAGRLENSGISPLKTTSLPDNTNLYIPKNPDWRYLSGFNINYHPKWVPGLVLGFTRSFTAYSSDVKANGFSAYLPFFTPFQKKNTNDGDPFGRDQITSLYARWLFTKAHAEIYFEYGLNDNSYNIHDFIGSPDHSRAYIFGLRKMLPFGTRDDEHILIGAEITQLAKTVDEKVRESGSWYTHYQVTQGHTHLGQVLGAGIGSGSNLQSVEVSWVKGLKRLGVSLERYEQAADFGRNAFSSINGNTRRWVDFAFALQGEWNYKNMLFTAKLQEIKSLNYEWILKDYTEGTYYIPHNDVYNFHAELGIFYQF